MNASSSRLIVVDGVTGSGKSTILKTMRDSMREQGYKIFDLQEWSRDHRDPPTLEEVSSYEVLFTFEPTKQWIGAAIRYEMSRTDRPYSGIELAHAFALDRLTQYRRLIIPALEAGKTIVQDRSVSTSLVYQPIMPNGPSLEDVLALPGNALALQYAPSDLILTHIDIERLKERFARNDDSKGVFEDTAFMKRAQERFEADWFKQLFQKNGTTFHTIDTNVSMEDMKKRAVELLNIL